MAKQFTVQDFYRRFPTDDACLDQVFRIRYGIQPPCPKCGVIGKFYKLKQEPTYTCGACGWHLHPMVGTPIAKKHTALQKCSYDMDTFTSDLDESPAQGPEC